MMQKLLGVNWQISPGEIFVGEIFNKSIMRFNTDSVIRTMLGDLLVIQSE